jgi:hypothetical protein
MGQQRAIAPLFFKESVNCTISIDYRWRNHSRLVRGLMEKIQPAAAGFETTAGGPALPMRLTNLPRFAPYWFAVSQQLVRKASRELLGRSLLPAARGAMATYPLARWRRDTLNCLAPEGLLDQARMHSGRLYDRERLAAFVQEAQSDSFNQEDFLSRILTVEMALRSVGASI